MMNDTVMVTLAADHRADLLREAEEQRRVAPLLRFSANIYHGLDADRFNPSYKTGKYLAFLGRLSPEKRPDRAIRLAERAGQLERLAEERQQMLHRIVRAQGFAANHTTLLQR